jgi:hypothetical protein
MYLRASPTSNSLELNHSNVLYLICDLRHHTVYHTYEMDMKNISLIRTLDL